MVCDTCGQAQSVEKFNDDCPNPNTCFRCRVSGVRLGIPGRSQDADLWRHSTIAEQQRTQVKAAADNGLEAIPAWTSTSYAPTKKQLDKLKTVS